MGWNATLVSNKEISMMEVEEIIKGLPNNLMMGFLDEVPFNGWGWSASTDIYVPDGNRLKIGGSYRISGSKAKPMSMFLKEKLEINGHDIKIIFGE